MEMARIYNASCGAHITHKDVESWGMAESAAIEAAIEFLSNRELLYPPDSQQSEGS